MMQGRRLSNPRALPDLRADAVPPTPQEKGGDVCTHGPISLRNIK